MGRPKQHDAATRAVLLAAAERLLATGGQDALTVRRVSETAGTSTRAVYSLFGGKDGLRAALREAALAELRRLIAAVPEGPDPVFDLVRTGIDGYRRLALARPHLFRLAFAWPEGSAAAGADRVAADRVGAGHGAANHGAANHGPANHGAAAAAAPAPLVARISRAAGPITTEAEMARLAEAFHALCLGLALTEAAALATADGSDALELWQEGLATYVLGFAAPAPR